MDRSAPLPPLPDRDPGLGGGAERAQGARVSPGVARSFEEALDVDVISHPAFVELHSSGRARRMRSARSGSGRLLERFPEYVHGQPATREQIERVHASRYVDVGRGDHRGRGVARSRTRMPDATTWEAALPGGGLRDRAVERGGFALVRPPGHHALARGRDGLLHLRERRDRRPPRAGGARARARVAIVDFDVHHGNGTEALFRDDPSVLIVSLHQWPFWPGTGGPGSSDEHIAQRPARRRARATTST